MATTSRPISELRAGIRDTSGNVVASGNARFYQPGTLVAQTVYSDAACTSAITQPAVLNAAGQYVSVYTLEPVRMIVKDSTDSTTYYDDIVNLNRHDALYVTHPSFNGGAETTLENILTSLGTNLGTDGNYKESAGATAIAYSTFLGQLCVSLSNFGAVGDGTTDDTTAIQAAFDRVATRGGGWVFGPKGTYKLTSAISITTAGVNFFGAGRGICVFKNFGTTTNAFTINISGDSKMELRDFSITANTTSSGAGITFTSGTNPKLQNIGIGLHRTGIGGTVAGAVYRDMHIDSTDDNAAAVGVTLGARSRLIASEVVSGTTNGTGVVASGSDSRVVDSYVTKFATGVTASGTNAQVNNCYIASAGTTGITLSGTNAQAKGCDIASAVTTGIAISGTEAMARDCLVDTVATGVSLTGARSVCLGSTVLTTTTGISLGVASAVARNNVVRAATTGFSVGAFANCVVVGNIASGNTTDLSVNASATGLIEHSNVGFSTLSDSATTPHSWLKDRAKVAKVTKVTSAVTSGGSVTPTPQSCDIYVAQFSALTSGPITINATSTTGLADGQRMTLVIQRTGGSGAIALSFNAQYGYDFSGGNTLAVSNGAVFPLVWRSSGAVWAAEFTGTVTPTATSNNW